MRVTTTTEPGQSLDGKLIAVSADQLTIHRETSKIDIHTRDIANFDVSIGYRRKTPKGLGVGFGDFVMLARDFGSACDVGFRVLMRVP